MHSRSSLHSRVSWGTFGAHTGKTTMGLDDEATSTSCRACSATAPAWTTSRAGPCASCRTWVGDAPNAATNLRFRTTERELTPDDRYRRRTGHVNRPRPILTHVTQG